MVQYDVDSPGSYLLALDEDWRKEKVLEIRKLIFELLPDVQEIISYKMLAYQIGDDIICHLNAQKGHVGLYVTEIGQVPNAEQDLAGFKYGKGCLYIKKRSDLKSAGFQNFLRNVCQIE